ncbi:MAG: EAL domain-containing protein [Acidimicrobiia bacterium]|nr:EAL domain-containing protein [Acidimicrobiia bacterium]
MTVLEPAGAAHAPRVQRADGSRISSITWRLFLGTIAAGALAASGWAAVPVGVVVAVGGLALLGLAVGVHAHRLDHALLWHVGRTRPWALLGVGLAGVVVLDGALATSSTSHLTALLAPLALGAYGAMAVGTLVLIRGRAPGRTVDSLLTSAIVATSVGLPAWVLAIEPRVGHELTLFGALTTFAIPVFDILVLGLLARLMLLSEEHPPVYNYLLLAVGALLAVHCIAAIGALRGVAHPFAALSGPLILAYGLWAAAALHPSMAGLFEPVQKAARRLSTSQLAALAGTLLIGPALLTVRAEIGVAQGNASIIVGSVLLTALVMGRLTRFVQFREEVEQAASHDSLTSLPRRELFNERVAISMAAASQRDGKMAVMFIDVDRFKKINDSLGHAVGDEVIELVGQRLRHCVRHDDMVARMGGDEFTLLLHDIADQHDAAAVAAKVIEAFSEPLHVAGRRLFVTASVGVAAYPRDGADPATLLKNADAAMYLAKEKGRNNFQVYTAELNARASEWLDLENALHAAITEGQLLVYYQPKIHIETGRVVGVEALVRWQHPELGLLGPDKFIPVAEENGLIAPLGEWVLEESCRQAKAWRDSGYKDLSVAVNLSARQFQLQAMDDVVAAVLRRTGLPPHLLELELTESLALQGSESVRTTLAAISAFGVKCAVDDFGVGFSNFGYLGTLPIDKVKVDKSFVAQIGTDDDGSASALAIGVIALAKALHLDVVAEGVETRQHLEFLHTHGCDQIQGYLFSAPLPADTLETLLMLEMVSPGTGRLEPQQTRPPRARKRTAAAPQRRPRPAPSPAGSTRGR